jgi:surface antigen
LAIASLISRAVVASLLALMAAGCTVSGKSLADAAPDQKIVTGSVAPDAPTPDQQDFASDRLIVQGTVSTVSLAEITRTDLSWSNPDTGSSGVVTRIAEATKSGVMCRTFQTTRLAFNGIGIFDGEICRASGGQWWTRSFTPI